MEKLDLFSDVRLIAFDFDGVFTDNTVYVTQDGVESVRCWRSDGLGLDRIRSIGIETIIISSENNPVVMVRAQKLKLRFKQGVLDKALEILAICEELQINPQQTMFVGNDINDIPALKSIGVPVGVADSNPAIYPYIVYRTEKLGGLGAVREICDLVFRAKKDGS